LKLLAPVGGKTSDQVLPPFLVAIIIDPAPLFPVFPTEMQSTEDEHEMPVAFTALDGTLRVLHWAPLSEVVMK
jgi:hypothetical protein